ncbi:MAG: glycosyl hydrolase [Abditibacteriales bacterium]|nr:glycosyl hydrolase [Abditibacteriales bacterium]
MRYCLLALLWVSSLVFVLSAEEPPQPIALPLAFDNLEGDWLFRTDPQQVGETEGWQKAEFVERGWRRLKVPGLWEEQGVTETYPGMLSPQLPPNLSHLPNAYNGVAWYRRRVVIPQEWRGEELEMFIGGVDDVDWVYVNGTLIGTTGAGEQNPSTLPRRYVVPANAVRFGAENVIAVRVLDYGGPGGIHQPPFYLLPRSYFARWRDASRKERSKNMSLREQFQSPPSHRRVLQIIHNFPSSSALTGLWLKSWKARGFGGIVCNVHFKDYLRSEENWQAFGEGVQQALDLGMTVWLYDEEGYPSGAAGGLTLEGHPEWEAMGLVCVAAETSGEPVKLDLPEGKVLSARAYPLRAQTMSLQGSTDILSAIRGRQLMWTPPAGRWRVLAFVAKRLYEGTHAEANLHAQRPYPNLLLPEPTARFIQLTHQEYARRFPQFLSSFEAIFTDEPSLMNVFLRPQPYPAIPWSPALPTQFKKAYGYDLLAPPPPPVCRQTPSKKVRCDFWRLIGKLVSANYFRQIQDWCRQHGIASTGHLLAEEDLRDHVGFYGNFYACVRYLDYPGIDCLTSKPATVPWHIAKLIGSIACLEGRAKTMSETSDFAQVYRPAGDKRPVEQVTEAEIRGTCHRLYVSGINTITSYYSWRGLSSEQQQRLNEHIGRLGVLLTGGQHVCDVAVFYPVESVWAHYVPATHGATNAPEAVAVERTYRAVSDQLFQNRRDFDYVDSDALRQAKVTRGRLHIAHERYRVLVLPHADTVPLDVWRKVAAFARGGGIVLAVGATPQNSLQNFPDAAVQRLSREIFGAGGKGVFIPSGAEATLIAALEARLAPDFKTQNQRSPLRYTHHRRSGREVYFIINDSADEVEETVSFSARGAAEIWDPATGNISSVKAAAVNGRTQMTLRLKEYGGVFVVFSRASG